MTLERELVFAVPAAGAVLRAFSVESFV